jgi:hypothetical protein
MRFHKLHLFIILLLSLVFCGCLGSFMREGMSSRQPTTTGTDNSATSTSSASSASSALPAGVPASQIPPGQEDMYILKSEIVPPVCPMCPQAAACPRQEKCPPCPGCARCPEPAFECKKVPNYASSNDNYLPRPIMSDFSQFGM